MYVFVNLMSFPWLNPSMSSHQRNLKALHPLVPATFPALFLSTPPLSFYPQPWQNSCGFQNLAYFLLPPAENASQSHLPLLTNSKQPSLPDFTQRHLSPSARAVTFSAPPMIVHCPLSYTSSTVTANFHVAFLHWTVTSLRAEITVCMCVESMIIIIKAWWMK